MLIPMASAPDQYFPRLASWEFLGFQKDDPTTSGLHARVIKSPSREKLLFSRHHLAQSETTVDAATLLTDLGCQFPGVAKDFVPKYHAQRSFIFRLISDVDSYEEEDGYIAISYCWKKVSREAPRKTITPMGDLPFGWTKEVEQFPLPTSTTIFQAVLEERRAGEGLWFDQVCINQEDEAEKAATMGAMDTIYKNARAVIVALDDIAVTPEEEQFLRPYIEQHSRSEWPPDQHPNLGISPPMMHRHPIMQMFLERILSSMWFERAWCVQEMKMGQSHVFILPCHSHYEDEEETVLRFTGAFFLHLLQLATEVSFSTPASHIRIRLLLKFFHQKASFQDGANLAVRKPEFLSSPVEERSITPIVAEVFQLKAGGNQRLPEHLRQLDANRDKMCIALNAAGLPLALTATNPYSRPNIEAECLRSLLSVGLAARDPVALCTTGPPLQLHDGSISWLCRPTTLDVNPARPCPSQFPRSASPITQGTDGRAEYAQLDLIFLDLPHRTRPNVLFPQHVARARVVIDLCIQYQLDGSALWNFWQAAGNPRALSMRNLYIQMLACLSDLGPRWCLDVHAQLKQPQEPAMQPHAIDMLLNPHLIIQNYIQLPEGHAALKILLNFISSLIASGMPWASGATERNYGPLIISPPNTTSDFDSPTSPPSHLGKAIIFAPFEHSKTLLIAVPEAVKNAAYGSLARGWILTSMNPYTGSPKPTVSWTLQSKGVVFGDGNFNATLSRAGAADVRHHRVYGPPVC